jgi:hypothetical protein
MIISPVIFDKFYKQNVSRLEMPKGVNYPISHNNLNIWLSNIQKIPQLTKFGYEFAQTLTHISFAEFYENLWKLGITLLQKFTTNKDPSVNKNGVYIYIGSNPQKSNLWCVLLLWSTIKPIVKGLLTSIDNNISDTILYIDDCSYSGNQVLKFINNTFPAHNGNFINNLIVCNVYISKNANTLISKKCNVIFINELPNFDNNIINNITNKKIREFLKLTDNLTNVYFDHKLASGLSIFQGILAFGLYPPTTNDFDEYEWRKKMPIKSLIRGCEDFYTNTNIGYLYLDSNDFHEDYKSSCPMPFYKTIKYTYDSQIISDLENLK